MGCRISFKESERGTEVLGDGLEIPGYIDKRGEFVFLLRASHIKRINGDNLREIAEKCNEIAGKR